MTDHNGTLCLWPSSSTHTPNPNNPSHKSNIDNPGIPVYIQKGKHTDTHIYTICLDITRDFTRLKSIQFESHIIFIYIYIWLFVNAGGIVIFSCDLWHCSAPNMSQNPRSAPLMCLILSLALLLSSLFASHASRTYQMRVLRSSILIIVYTCHRRVYYAQFSSVPITLPVPTNRATPRLNSSTADPLYLAVPCDP